LYGTLIAHNLVGAAISPSVTSASATATSPSVTSASAAAASPSVTSPSTILSLMRSSSTCNFDQMRARDSMIESSEDENTSQAEDEISDTESLASQAAPPTVCQPPRALPYDFREFGSAAPRSPVQAAPATTFSYVHQQLSRSTPTPSTPRGGFGDYESLEAFTSHVKSMTCSSANTSPVRPQPLHPSLARMATARAGFNSPLRVSSESDLTALATAESLVSRKLFS
jgi:hypothetical protein